MFNRLAFENLRRDPLHTLAGVLVVSLEVAVLLIMTGIRRGMASHPGPQPRQMGILFIVMLGFVWIVSFCFAVTGRHTAVVERVQEIGLLRVLGASSGYIFSLLLQETVFITVLGTILGIVLAYGSRWLILQVLANFFTQEAAYTWWTIGWVIAAIGDLLGVSFALGKVLREDNILQSISYGE